MKDIPVRKLRSKLDAAKNVRIIAIEDLLTEGRMDQKTHRHDFYLLLFFGSGSGKHKVDFQPFTLKPRSVFVLRPGQVHALTINPGATGRIVEFNSAMFDFERSAKIALLKKLSNTVFYELNENDFAKLITLLQFMTTELKDKKKNFFKSITSYLDLMLIELDRIQVSNKYEKENSYEIKKFDEMVDLLDKYVLEHKSVSDFAQMMGLSSFQLNKITKTLQGKTFSEMLKERKILECKRLLLGTSLQIKEIAFKLGFDDVSYFSRYFKKQSGLSPIKFRQKHN